MLTHSSVPDYDLLADQLKALTMSERDRIPGLANASALIYDALPDLNWCGFYLTVPSKLSSTSYPYDLLLGPFQGKTACIRIPYGKGVCGTAAGKDEIQLVPDVHLFPGHIACDSASNSEIVIPMHRCDGTVAGVLDIDSPLPGRFSQEDAGGLARLVRILEGNCDL